MSEKYSSLSADFEEEDECEGCMINRIMNSIDETLDKSGFMVIYDKDGKARWMMAKWGDFDEYWISSKEEIDLVGQDYPINDEMRKWINEATKINRRIK